MKISRKLNVVFPITVEDGSVIYIHSTPLSRAVIDTNARVLGLTFAEIYTGGLGPLAGPRVAATILRDIATERNIASKVEMSLFNEVHRLTNVLLPTTSAGWETIPYVELLRKDIIDEDSASEVENALIYFTVALSMHLTDERAAAMEAMTMLWKAHFTSSNVTEYRNSLTTSTGAVNTGVKAIVSSIPS